MKQGDLKPDLVVNLTDDGHPIDLTGARSVTVVGSRDGSVIFSRPATLVDELGEVQMSWEAGDTDGLGYIDIEVEVEWTDGLQTFEPSGRIVVEPPVPRTRLLTVEDLSNHMSGVTFSPAQYADAEAVLRGLERSLERRLARRFVEAQATERVFADEVGWAMLTRTPVKAVLSVDGLVPWTINTWQTGPTRNGLNGLAPLSWSTVVYRGGGFGPENDDTMEDVKLAILEKAADLMRNRHDDTQSVKDLDTREPIAAPAGTFHWTDAELDESGLTRLRRRVVI